MSATTPVLQVVGLAKRFRGPGGEREAVLDDVDFSLRPGSFTLVVGAAGSGRTTLLRCLYRTLQPDRGHAYLATAEGVVDLAGAPPPAVSWARRHHIRMASDELVAPDRATAGAFLSRALRRSGTTAVVADRRAANTLGRFEIPAERPLRHVDEAGRAAIAFLAATLPPSTVALFDEPFSHQTEDSVEPFLQSMAETCQRGTAVMATADLGSPYEGFADTVILLQQGRAINGSGSAPASIRRSPRR